LDLLGDGPPGPNILEKNHEVPTQEQSSTRVYVFNQDKTICKSIERFLGFKGAITFDPWNIVSLRFIQNIDCLVFIHRGDVDIVHNIPNLLQLKRDLRVNFVIYNDVMDVKFKKFDLVFPKGGLVVMEDAVLLDSKTEVIKDLCEFMVLQSKERSKPWMLILSAAIFDHIASLKKANMKNVDEFERLTEISQILDNYRSDGVVDLLSEDFLVDKPKIIPEYLSCCSELQTKYLSTYRHFLFLTDMPKEHKYARQFVDRGIDVLNISDFMRGFISKNIEHKSQLNQFYNIQEMPEIYSDPVLSSAIEKCIRG
jgi:hypothetical protein